MILWSHFLILLLLLQISCHQVHLEGDVTIFQLQNWVYWAFLFWSRKSVCKTTTENGQRKEEWHYIFNYKQQQTEMRRHFWKVCLALRSMSLKIPTFWLVNIQQISTEKITQIIVCIYSRNAVDTLEGPRFNPDLGWTFEKGLENLNFYWLEVPSRLGLDFFRKAYPGLTRVQDLKQHF